MKIITKSDLDAILIGGSILGGGGGGSIAWGRELADEVFDIGNIELKSLDEIDDEAFIITASGVGAPAAPDCYAKSDNYVRAVELLMEQIDGEVAGVITSENGGMATVNGWVQSARLGLPIIDAPCNGRAHPAGVMGSLSLGDDYTSVQAFSGGNPALNNQVEGVVKASLNKASNLVRQAAVEAGGVVAVARNPITVKYAKEHAAIGGISKALEVGEVFLAGLESSPLNAIQAVATHLNGEIICQGNIDTYELLTSGGYDVGRLVVDGYEATVWNEYMTLEKDGQRLYSFPDLIMTFDMKTGLPITSAELKEGVEVVILATRSEHIPLGSPMRDRSVLDLVTPVIGKAV